MLRLDLNYGTVSREIRVKTEVAARPNIFICDLVASEMTYLRKLIFLQNFIQITEM